MQYENEILADMKNSGLLVDHLIFDGAIQRVPTTKKPKQEDGYYVVLSDGQSVLYGDWGTGIERVYSVKGVVFSRDVLLACERMKVIYKQEKLTKQKESAKQCQRIWSSANKVVTHPYLTRKQIKPYGSRIDRYNNLLVPILNNLGDLVNLQFIDADGKKRYKAGALVKGAALLIGNLTEQSTVLVCEGYATACSLNEATKLPVIVSFTAGNLLDVCTSLRLDHPTKTIVICADNDHKTEVKTGINTGLESAKVAAKKFNLHIVWPNFDSDNLGSDFNDVHCQQGLACLRSKLSPVVLGGNK